MTYVPVGTQQDLLETRAPMAVALGGAGTGKTVTAAAAAALHLRERDHEREALRHLMIEAGAVQGLPPRARALFLTFSRTAVAQVLDRASTVVGPLLDRIDVVTFHGFAWRVLNDWGGKYGSAQPLRIVTAAEAKVPGTPAGFRYDELIPAARRVLENPTVSAYYGRRYSLVLCDEFQDTDDKEWEFFRAIAPAARRIVLGDVNQCIYAEMKRIDPDRRVAEALALPGAVRIPLPTASQRDPSGVLPAAADAARERRFNDPAILAGVRAGRLVVTRVDDATRREQVVALVRAERAARRSVSVFTHSNALTAQLSDDLTVAGVRHEQVGLSEAYGEALNAQLAMVRYAIEAAPARRALAVYVAANHRADTPLVRQIMDMSNPTFERALQMVATELQRAGQTGDMRLLAEVVEGAYARLGTHRGQQTWRDAARSTRAALRRVGEGVSLDDVALDIERARHRALLDDTGSRARPVQVMNLHQTKGREADATILLLQPDEYHGRERPPYPTLSRLLYVVLTRARVRAHIVVPDEIHPLWRPLVEACERVQVPT